MGFKQTFLDSIFDLLKQFVFHIQMPLHLYNARRVDELTVIEEKDGFLVHPFLFPDPHQMPLPVRIDVFFIRLGKGRRIGRHRDDERLAMHDRKDDSEVLVPGFIAIGTPEIDEANVARADAYAELFAGEKVRSIQEITVAQHVFRRIGDALVT